MYHSHRAHRPRTSTAQNGRPAHDTLAILAVLLVTFVVGVAFALAGATFSPAATLALYVLLIAVYAHIAAFILRKL